MQRNTKASDDTYYVPPVQQEFAKVDLGDRRLNARVIQVVDQMTPAPNKSLPQATVTRKNLQAAYRLLENPRVASADLMKPHIVNTLDRCAKAGLAIVAHDTSEFIFPGVERRADLGSINSANDQGFLAHFSFGFSADASSTPLGTLAMTPWVRTKIGKNKAKKQKASKAQSTKDDGTQIKNAEEPSSVPLEEKESVRWLRQVEAVDELLAGKAEAIHVADREADIHSCLMDMRSQEIRFVVRASSCRLGRLDEQSSTEEVFKLADAATGLLDVEVDVSARRKSQFPCRAYPPRERRKARLTFSGVKMQLRRPTKATKETPEWVPINMVHVVEPSPPEGAEPVEWYLYTSEPVDTAEQVKAIVDYYRKRWGIEEFFKALKTGCSVKERQLESYDVILNFLALCLPMAWQMLLLRTISRYSPGAPATIVLTPRQIDVLRNCGHELSLPINPTAHDALLAVAALGGYIKTKRPPGWLTLGRGMEVLLNYEIGWIARENSPQRCAQS